MKAANLVLRFLLELGALGAVGYWGWKTGGWILAVAAVAAVVIVWWLYVAPKARYDLAPHLRFGVELVVWGVAGAALIAADQLALGLAFVVLAVASGSLNFIWTRPQP